MKKLITLSLSVVACILFTFTAFAGTWKLDSVGWWWDNGNGTWPANYWQWYDGNYICFEDNAREIEGEIVNGVIKIHITNGAYYYVKANADTSWIGAMSSGQYALSLFK